MYRELTARDITEVLLRYAAGQSQRQIGREVGLGRNTVSRYIKAARVTGFAGGAPSDAHVESVRRFVKTKRPAEPSEQWRALAAQRELIRSSLETNSQLTKVRLLLEDKGVKSSYATLRRFVRSEFSGGDQVGSRQRPEESGSAPA